MDSLDDPENTTKVSDSAYSTSCSNSQSRRSHSSKSTHSSSQSSNSSGYCGKATSSDSHKDRPPSEKRAKGKDGKKKSKHSHDDGRAESATAAKGTPQNPGKKTETGHQKPKRKYSAAAARAQTPQLEPSDDNTDDMAWTNSTSKAELTTTSNITNLSLNCCDSQHRANHNRGFSCIISMRDGVVMCATSTITCTLGFPKDMWVGRSFIDFIHPKDRQAFSSQIVSEVIAPKALMSEFPSAEKPAQMVDQTVYCRIRTHRHLGSGFSLKSNTMTFLPFILTLSFKDIADETGKKTCLLVQTTLLSPAYKAPCEPVTEPTFFTTRHIANGRVQSIDRAAIPFLGYFPQDIRDQDILMLYHPDDLAHLFQVYDAVLQKGASKKSQVYRLQAQNGNYLKLETEFTSFINPCSQKLEFIDGKHCVVQGPGNPDVFQTPTETPVKLDDEQKYKAHILREKIFKAMNDVSRKHTEAVKLVTTDRCMNLANLMLTLIHHPPRAEKEPVQEPDINCFERDSEILGGISPHHENGSNSGAETPLSYNTLNYNENLQRYFDSYIHTLDTDNAGKSEQAKTGYFDSYMRTADTDNAEKSEQAKTEYFDTYTHPADTDNAEKSEQAKTEYFDSYMRTADTDNAEKSEQAKTEYFDTYTHPADTNNAEKSEQAKPEKPAETSASSKDKDFAKTSAMTSAKTTAKAPAKTQAKTSTKKRRRPRLTEGVLNKHNNIMKKNLLKKQRGHQPENRRRVTKRSRQKKRNHAARYGAAYPTLGPQETVFYSQRPSWQCDVTMNKLSLWADPGGTPFASAPLPTKTTQTYVNTTAARGMFPMYYVPTSAAIAVLPTMSNIPIAETMVTMSNRSFAATMSMTSVMPNASTIPIALTMPDASTMSNVVTKPMSHMQFAATVPMKSTMPTISNIANAAMMPTTPLAATISMASALPIASTIPNASTISNASNTETMSKMSFAATTPIKPETFIIPTTSNMPFGATMSISSAVPAVMHACQNTPIMSNKNMPYAANTPTMSNMPFAADTPNMSNMPFAANTPIMSNMPFAANSPTMSNMPFAENTPTMSNMPFAENTPTMSNMSFAENTPTMSNMPFAANTLTLSNMPFAADTPTILNLPFAANTPTMTNIPFAANTPTMSNMPFVAKTPIISNMPFATNTPNISNMPFAATMPITSYQNVASGTPYGQGTGPYPMYGQSAFGAPFAYPPARQRLPEPVSYAMLPLSDENFEQVCPSYDERCAIPRDISRQGNKRIESQTKPALMAPVMARNRMRQARGQSRLSRSTSNSGLDSSDQTFLTESDEGRERHSYPTTSASVPSDGIYRFRKETKTSHRNRSDLQEEFTSAEKTDGESNSSFSSSFFKTDSGSNEESDSKNIRSVKDWAYTTGNDVPKPDFMLYGDNYPPKRKGAPWAEEVDMTPDLEFRYQMEERNPEEVLAADKARLEKMEQSVQVNEQLSEMYLEMQRKGLPQDLALDEGITSSSSSEDESSVNTVQKRQSKSSRRKRDYNRDVMIYEEDAPMPSAPIDDPVVPSSPIASCSK